MGQWKLLLILKNFNNISCSIWQYQFCFTNQYIYDLQTIFYDKQISFLWFQIFIINEQLKLFHSTQEILNHWKVDFLHDLLFNTPIEGIISYIKKFIQRYLFFFVAENFLNYQWKYLLQHDQMNFQVIKNIILWFQLFIKNNQ